MKETIMKKTIIAIWGRSNLGKTDTIRRIARKLTRKYLMREPTLEEIPEEGDFELIITIIDDITLKELKIGIKSKGDPRTGLKESLLNFENCHLIICATRTSGETVVTEEQFAEEHGYYTIWATPYNFTNSARRPKINDLCAEHIIELIERLVKGCL